MKRSKTAHPHLNTNLPIKERVEYLVSKLTLREKISQMVHAAPPIPRLRIEAHNWWNECLHGVARAGRATVFPQAIGMAASFNTRLLRKAATVISDEARAKHHAAARMGNRSIYFGLTYWTPNINIFRDPRWGRGQETYGEDPFLTARMGVAFIKGLQGTDPKYLKLVATAKHYAVHSGPETLRHEFDAIAGPRDLRETYLPAFKACVQEANVQSIMGAYNRTNGEPCCGSPKLLQQILRDEWGFDGYVVSDCWAIMDFHTGHKITKTEQESGAMALQNGCDLNCGSLYRELLGAVDQGLITEADVDRAVTRLFTARMKLGMFDPPSKVPYSKIKASVVNSAAHRKTSLQMARESIVLLKNQKALPLRKDMHNVAVVGPCAMNIYSLLGNYNGFAPNMKTIFEGVLDKVSVGTKAETSKGCDLTGDKPIEFLDCGVQFLKDADAVVAVVGYTAEIEGEEGCTDGGGDRSIYGLPGRQQELLETLRGYAQKLIVVAVGGSPIDLSWAQKHADAVLFAWYPGESGGEAVADVLFGDYNPAGRLPITFPKSYDQLPAFEDYRMAGRTYRFMKKEPLYRFGYGLSYTTFAYRKLKLTPRRIRSDQSVAVSVEVKNTGKLAGDEVAQLYVIRERNSVPVPRLHLEGFARVRLDPGESQTVEFTLKPAQLTSYDDEGNPFTESGSYLISVGGGQPDDAQSGAVSSTLKVSGTA